MFKEHMCASSQVLMHYINLIWRSETDKKIYQFDYASFKRRTFNEPDNMHAR